MAFTEPARWYVISLRPQGEHAALRRAARKRGARVLALSPWRLRFRDDADTRKSLDVALAADRVLFTSPVAVRAAAALASLSPLPGQTWIAVGAGTAEALRLTGVTQVQAPARMDSEGLLDLPALQALQGVTVGLVTAPEGRGVLAPSMAERGATVLRADIYERVPLPLSKAAIARLIALRAPAVLALSSAGALEHVLAELPGNAADHLRSLPVVAASARLQRIALEAGFRTVRVAEGPASGQLVQAASEANIAGIR